MDTNDQINTNKRTSDTAASVFEFIFKNTRTTAQSISEELNIPCELTENTLTLLLDMELIKERQQSKLGTVYYYPNDKKLFCIYVFLRPYSFVFVTDLLMNTEYFLNYFYNDEFYPDINLHLFLKKASQGVRHTFGYIPGDRSYLVMNGKMNENNRWQSEMYPEFILTPDLCEYAGERLGDDNCALLSQGSESEMTEPRSQEHQKSILLDVVRSLFQ